MYRIFFVSYIYEIFLRNTFINMKLFLSILYKFYICRDQIKISRQAELLPILSENRR